VHTIKKTQKLPQSLERRYVGLEVKAKQTKNMIMPQDQNARQNHNTQINKKSFARGQQFKYLETTLTNRNSIHEEIKSRLKSRNACYHSVQNILSSTLLSKNIKIKTHRKI